MLRLHLGYPDDSFEREILRDQRRPADLSMVRPVVSGERVLAMQEGTRRVRIDDSLIDYIVALVGATRTAPRVELGGSTRAALSLRNCAQAHAYLNGRDYCQPDDVKSVAGAVLAHRLSLARSFEETIPGTDEAVSLVRSLLEQIPVPL